MNEVGTYGRSLVHEVQEGRVKAREDVDWDVAIISWGVEVGDAKPASVVDET